MFVEYHIFNNICMGAVCLTGVAIGSYEGPSKKYESVEARYENG
jgi:hypothetical protein